MIGQSSYVYSVEYFGVRSTINRTKIINDNTINCEDCTYLKDLKDKKIHLINKHRYSKITVMFLYFRCQSTYVFKVLQKYPCYYIIGAYSVGEIAIAGLACVINSSHNAYLPIDVHMIQNHIFPKKEVKKNQSI